MLGIERAIFDTHGQQKSLTSLRSGELVLVKLEVTAKRNVPDALVVDLLLQRDLSWKTRTWPIAAPACRRMAKRYKTCLTRCSRRIFSISSSAMTALSPQSPSMKVSLVTLVYLARAVTPGTYQVPQPQVESMYVPQWRATGTASGPLTVTP